MSWTWTIFGCRRPATASASRRKRSRDSGLACAPVSSILRATGAVEAQVPGLVDDAHAAAAQHLVEFMPGIWGRSAEAGSAKGAEGRVGPERREHRIQLGVAVRVFAANRSTDLRQQLGAMAADFFRRLLRVQQFFEQLSGHADRRPSGASGRRR